MRKYTLLPWLNLAGLVVVITMTVISVSAGQKIHKYNKTEAEMHHNIIASTDSLRIKSVLLNK